MAKVTLVAVFNGREFTRTTSKPYSHGWALQFSDGSVTKRISGFASSEDRARKAGGAYLKYFKGATVLVAPATVKA